jgi:hypothetical protein
MTIDPQTIAIYDEKTDEYATLTEGVPHDLARFGAYLPPGGAGFGLWMRTREPQLRI